MANFENTTGWREDLASYEASQSHRDKLHHVQTQEGSTDPFSRSEIIQMLELMAQDDACQSNGASLAQWRAAHPGLDDPMEDDAEDLGYPWDAPRVLEAFLFWFRSQTGDYKDTKYDLVIRDVFVGICAGTFSGANDPAILDHFDHWDQRVAEKRAQLESILNPTAEKNQ